MAREIESLRMLRRVTDALRAEVPLDDRLARVFEIVVPALCQRCEILGGDERRGGDCALELPLEGGGEPLGTLRLERAAPWSEADRLVAEEVAARVADCLHANRRLLQAEMNDEFLATLSHELRTPLNVVVGWADMLRSGRLGEDKSRRALDLIERNARVQVRLVDDLLDASRIASGRLHLRVEDVALGDAVEAAIEALSPMADELGLELTCDPDTNPRVRADPDRLTQMVHNLVGNALKFTPRGGRIDVAIAEDGDRAVVSVTDTGAGIDAELAPRLFERFWQGERRRLARSRGLGLGLFITRSLARLQNGDVSAESAGPGEGSRFCFWLPRLG